MERMPSRAFTRLLRSRAGVMMRRWTDLSRGDGTVHIVPVNDLKAHRERGVHCWCDPAVTRYESGAYLVVHNSLDGRELIEQHGLQ